MPITTKKSPSLKLLITKLKEIQLAFDDIWNFVQESKENVTATDVNIRLTRLDEIWEKYAEALIEIKSHDDFDDSDDSYNKERIQYSDRYYRTKSVLMDQAKELEEPSSLNQSLRFHDASTHGTMEHVRLPQIKLQSFNGDIDEWLSFRDLYTSLIHWKVDLPEVEKFHYLKGCLQGEPKSLIDPLKITKANYQVAWDLLLKRYNNSKQLKKRQAQSLFQLPMLTKESVADLHTLMEGFERTVQTLDQIIEPADYKDLLLVNLLISRLDTVTRRGWEEYSSTKDQDSLTDLLEFLRRRIRVLESLPAKGVESKSTNFGQRQQGSKAPAVFKTTCNSAIASGGRCLVCKDNHFLYQCTDFQMLSVGERDALLKTHSLCRNCFKTGHMAKECKSKYSCRNCKGRHHTLVCFRMEKETNKKVATVARGNNPSTAKESEVSGSTSSVARGNNPSTVKESEVSGSTSSQVAQVAQVAATTVFNATRQIVSQGLLATAVVILKDDEDIPFLARALLDSGSETNFITKRFSQRMKICKERVDISVLGIGQTAIKVQHRVEALVRSRVSTFSKLMKFLVLPKVAANLQTTAIDTTGWTIPDGIKLADPAFYQSKGVDIVLGIGSFFNYFKSGRNIKLGNNLPELNESVFGWVVSGESTHSSSDLNITCNVSTTEGLDTLVARFWECEEVGSEKITSTEEKRCEELFQRSVQRGADGRYTVALPLVEDALVKLGDSKDIAMRRLHGTDRRLARDANLRRSYEEFMDDYVLLGHMRLFDEHQHDGRKRCFLPHHPVFKEESTTTKVRVVFDASCKTSTGVSLNDVLLAGPVIQEDLRSIVLRCRTRRIMIVSDVEKMFRQIYVAEEHRALQSILWHSNSSAEASVYELTTVTYGTKSAPFLATRTLLQLATDEGDKYPLAAKAVKNDTYMDDVITGAETVGEASELRRQLTEMMTKGGFRLRKWASNCPEVLDGVPESELAIPTATAISLDPYPALKTLGITWTPKADTFSFHFNVAAFPPDSVLTKRRILSVIATLYDPLGLLGAAITTAKIMMQLLWIVKDDDDQKLDWDQPVPSAVAAKWLNFHEQLPLLNEIQVERCVIIENALSVEFHCFSDASEKAYGCCLYVRSLDACGRVMVRLLTSKSRVSPLKCQTIPRLELCGAVLAVQLFEKVRGAVKLEGSAFFWTDSTCVLRWLQATPTTWTTYVANRVSKIQSITCTNQWRHVPGLENPADLISRGITPRDITTNRFWWQGPEWLEKPPDKWPKCLAEPSAQGTEQERRRTAVACGAAEAREFSQWYMEKFSTNTGLIRKTAYWLRLIQLLRTPATQRKKEGYLTTAQLKNAEITLIRRLQQECFAEEWNRLSKGEPMHKRSPLRWFNPQLTSDMVIRVGGRLGQSEESEDTKHPIVLPARHLFTRLVFEQYHKQLLHAGPQLLLGVVRLKFWPLGGRNVARLVVHNCIKCFRSKPSAAQQLMGELPTSRVTVSRPFSKSGVDYFGPIYITPAPRRAAIKAYVAIFVCMCTKAVHMELVTDLSTDCFLQALRRFISRRGRCSDLYSDNGTNFVGAKNRLQEFLHLLKSKDHHETISKECIKDGIQWHFNPPSAPHFGGLWEAAVRSAKKHLLKVIGENPLPAEHFNTLLIQVEGCLNSRPLTPLSDDPLDLEPLTPAHFLTGSSLQSFPEPDLSLIPMNRLNRWQQVQKKLQEFWQRWRREYLCQLQGRMKRWKPPIPIEIGRLVVLQEDNLPPMRWKMARIIDVHPGNDGVVRVVTLKTTTGTLKRPVEKLCLLPLPDYSEEL